jgi:hypothetical protein
VDVGELQQALLAQGVFLRPLAQRVAAAA